MCCIDASLKRCRPPFGPAHADALAPRVERKAHRCGRLLMLAPSPPRARQKTGWLLALGSRALASAQQYAPGVERDKPLARCPRRGGAGRYSGAYRTGAYWAMLPASAGDA